MKARIVATGSYWPTNVVTNYDLETIMDTSNDWIIQRTGIKERRFSDVGTIQMGYEAALDALNNSDIDKNDIDAIIVCTTTPEKYSPSTGSIIAGRLELNKDIPAFDINAACTGFIYGLKVAQAFIESNQYQTILVVAAEHLSKMMDFSNRSTAVLFGDGSGAAILKADDVGIMYCEIANRPDMNGYLGVKGNYDVSVPFTNFNYYEEPGIIMDGQQVFKFATSVFVKMLKECLEKNNLTFDDIKYVIPHQANLRIIEYACKVLKIDRAKFVVNIERFGNTSAASVPILLDEVNKAGKLQKGDKIILIAFGSGLTYGVSLIEW